ncbi:MAG: hypothetical protein HJJLKODD_01472 [Phycisphaerae bacterium]|nr:hypothetical protein [Phycisphaerae bacterium]
MSRSRRPWNIGDLADLLLGPAASNEPVSTSPRHSPDGDRENAALSPEILGIHYNPVLISPEQDPVEAVSRYADYWSNRGQRVTVVWLGDAGIKIGLFDPARRNDWGREIVQAIEAEKFEEVGHLLHQSVRRLVCVLLTRNGWCQSPFIEAGSAATVIVEPSSQNLVRGYEIIKALVASRPNYKISSFVARAESALQATEISVRLENMGWRFLGRGVDFEGFSLEEKWPTSNLIAETYLTDDGAGQLDAFCQVLLDFIHSQPTTPLPESPAQVVPPELHLISSPETAESEPELVESASVTGAATDPPIATDNRTPLPVHALPEVRVWRTSECLQTTQELDRLIADSLSDLCNDIQDTYPIYTSPDSRCCYRWVIHRNGHRTLVISSIEAPVGALERAMAQLHPLQEHDQVMLLSSLLTTECRKAAQTIAPQARLFELARLPDNFDSAILLKEVTTAIA